MYLEGSDQHRGWFQSSLLESCGTRGRAPFDIVLTHGFTLDEKGRKMSKSLGNQTFPQDIIKASGADILRLWVGERRLYRRSAHRPGNPEDASATTTASCATRSAGCSARWRITTRATRSALRAMAELERLMLHRSPNSTAKVREAYADFDYARVIAALSAFMNADLSAFYFDIRKDALYCEPPSSAKRRGALEAIEHIFRAVTVWLAPILVFTAEEAWASRDPQRPLGASRAVPDHPRRMARRGAGREMGDRCGRVRSVVTGAIEIARADKRIGSSLEAHPRVYVSEPEHLDGARGRRFRRGLHHLRHRRSRRDAGAGRRVPARRDVPDVAVVVERAERDQMRALVALFRSRRRPIPEYPDVTPRDAAALRELAARSA